MKLIKAIKGIKEIAKVFPKEVTNNYLGSLHREELAPNYKDLPYAKYYYKPIAKIPEEDLYFVNNGPMAKKDILKIEDRHELFEDGYKDKEVGYALLEDGSSYAATKVFMKGVTKEMLVWWFIWHSIEPLRYMIWYPDAHTNIYNNSNGKYLDTTNIPAKYRIHNTTHYPHEGYDVKGSQQVAIKFLDYNDFGITEDQLNGNWPFIGLIHTQIAFIKIPTCIFLHSIREVEGGVEYRSRYWFGKKRKKDGRIVNSWSPVSRPTMEAIARNQCIHSLVEYNNLASILPELFKQYNGKVE